jgi:hypothetical protein
MSVLKVAWQRLVNDAGQTCPRCEATETAVRHAVAALGRSLAAVDVEVALEERALTQSAFIEDPLESNRIWIAGLPLEAWLGATVGESGCCSACGDSDCRTLTVEEDTYEAIPSELIVTAGLLAAADLIKRRTGGACCPSPDPAEASRGCCGGSSA